MKVFDVVPPNENFRGRSYGEWAAEWWKWVVSENPDTYSLDDPIIFLRANIDYYYTNNNGETVRRQTGKHYNRTGSKQIEIYEGTAIFFPIVEVEFNEGDTNPEDNSKSIHTESDMRKLARKDIDQWYSIGATIRIGTDTPVPIVGDLKKFRAESPLFALEVSDKNPLKDRMETVIETGNFKAVTDGYWILIRSLASSDLPYQIHFEASGHSVVTKTNICYSATYDILVKTKKDLFKDQSNILANKGSLFDSGSGK